MTLTEFLLARILEDEAVAKAAIADDEGADEGFANQYDYLTRGELGDSRQVFGEDAARLIVRFAVPARVLAECEAKRRIIEKAEAWAAVALEDQDGEAAILAIGLQVAYPFLALPYADHPDYLPEWKR